MVIESEEDSYPGYGYQQQQQNYASQQNHYYSTTNDDNYYSTTDHQYSRPPLLYNDHQYSSYVSNMGPPSPVVTSSSHSHQQYHPNHHVMPPVAVSVQPQPGWRRTNSDQYFSMQDSNGQMAQLYNHNSASKFAGGHGIGNDEYGTNDYETPEYVNWGNDRRGMYQKSSGAYNGYQQKGEWVYT